MSSKRTGWSLVLALPLGCGPIGGEVVDIYDGQGSVSSGSTSSGGEGEDRGSSTIADGSGDATAPGTSTGMVTQGDTTQGVDPGTSTGNASTSESTGAGSSSEGPGPTTTSSSSSCDEIFGAAPGYVLCMETETACRFSADILGTNCMNICSMFGGVCTGAFNNPPDAGMECVANFAEHCNTTHMDEICVCDK